MDALTRYAMGFVVSLDGRRVVLLRKNRPSYLAGLWMGPAGHVEPGESPLEAVRREFEEEAGVHVPDWTFVRLVERPERPSEIHVFFGCHDLAGVRTATDEEVRVFELAEIDRLPMGNALREVRLDLEQWAARCSRG